MDLDQFLSHEQKASPDPLRQARIEAHAAFDKLWKTGLLTRGEAYAWLVRAMGKKATDCHIRRFTIAECATAERLVWELFNVTRAELDEMEKAFDLSGATDGG